MKLATPLKTSRTLHTRLISGNDPEIGEIIMTPWTKWVKTAITIEDQGYRHHCRSGRRYELDRGYLSAYFVTDTDAMEAGLRTRSSLSTKRRSPQLQTLPLLENVAESAGPADYR